MTRSLDFFNVFLITNGANRFFVPFSVQVGSFVMVYLPTVCSVLGISRVLTFPQEQVPVSVPFAVQVAGFVTFHSVFP